MNELKEPLFKRIGHFIINHSTALAVVILLVVVLLASFQKALAGSFPDSSEFYIRSFLSSSSNYSSSDEALSHIFNTYDGYAELLLDNGNRIFCFNLENLYPYEPFITDPGDYLPPFKFSMVPFQQPSFYSFYFGDISLFNLPSSYISNGNLNKAYCASIYYFADSNTIQIYEHVIGSYNYSSYSEAIRYVTVTSRDDGFFNNSIIPTSYFRIEPVSSARININNQNSHPGINGVEICTILSGSGPYLFNSSYAIFVTPITIYDNPFYVSDDRLKLWTINNDSGSQELVIDFTDFGTDTSNSSISYSSLSLDIEIDGVASKIDSLDRYIEKVGNPLYSSQDIMAYIPYSVFNIDSALNAKITGVSFVKHLSTQSGEPTSETFNIAVDYYLKQEVSSVSPDPIVKDLDTVSSKLTVSEITSVRNLNNYGSLQFHDVDVADIVFPENFDILFVSLSSQSSIQTVLDTVLDILAGLFFDPDGSTLLDALQRAALLNFNGITSESDAHNKIMDILGDQFYSTVFDIIYFTYDPGNGDAYTYWYYFTEAGRLRVANSYLADIYVEANQSSYTLGSIYNFLYERLNDFEEKSLIAITGSNTLLAKSNEWLQSILNAVNNIRIPDYSGSFSSIISGINELNGKSFFDPRLYNVLSAILAKLDNWPSSGGSSGSGNINNETYERFTAWLDGVNDLDGIMTPEELANDQFGLIGDLYSYFAEGLYSQIDGFDIGPISFARDLFDNMKSGSDHAYYNFHRQSIDLTRFR